MEGDFSCFVTPDQVRGDEDSNRAFQSRTATLLAASTAPKKPLKAARMTSAKMPEQCETMIEVREGVDQVDRELVALLVRRFGYMDAAARIKTERGAVRDEARKAQVLDNVARAAEAAGLDGQRIRAVWNELVEQSIAHEFDRWDGMRA